VEASRVIVIKANPARIEEISFTGETAAERAIEAAVFTAVESIINQLDRKLRTLNRQVLAGLEQQGRA
jgi:hypothetical protein